MQVLRTGIADEHIDHAIEITVLDFGLAKATLEETSGGLISGSSFGGSSVRPSSTSAGDAEAATIVDADPAPEAASRKAAGVAADG